jgi:hypothetical protein
VAIKFKKCLNPKCGVMYDKKEEKCTNNILRYSRELFKKNLLEKEGFNATDEEMEIIENSKYSPHKFIYKGRLKDFHENLISKYLSREEDSSNKEENCYTIYTTYCAYYNYYGSSMTGAFIESYSCNETNYSYKLCNFYYDTGIEDFLEKHIDKFTITSQLSDFVANEKLI